MDKVTAAICPRAKDEQAPILHMRIVYSGSFIKKRSKPRLDFSVLWHALLTPFCTWEATLYPCSRKTFDPFQNPINTVLNKNMQCYIILMF